MCSLHLLHPLGKWYAAVTAPPGTVWWFNIPNITKSLVWLHSGFEATTSESQGRQCSTGSGMKMFRRHCKLCVCWKSISALSSKSADLAELLLLRTSLSFPSFLCLLRDVCVWGVCAVVLSLLHQNQRGLLSDCGLPKSSELGQGHTSSFGSGRVLSARHCWSILC